MRVKTFQAATMTEALRAIKAEFGEDAVILSTTQLKQGGLFGFGSKSLIEVQAAVDDHPPPPLTPSEDQEEDNTEEASEFDQQVLAELAKPDLAAPEHSQRRSEIDSHGYNPGKPLDDQDPSASWQSQLPQVLTRAYRHLIEVGCQPHTARHLVTTVLRERPEDAVASPHPIRQRLRSMIASAITTAPPLLIVPTDKRLVLFVGPAGGGKTSAIQRLTALLTAHPADHVAILALSSPHHPSALVLQHWAKRLGITMAAVTTVRDALTKLEHWEPVPLVMIEASGWIPSNPERLIDLRWLRASGRTLDTQLVLPATLRDREAIRSVTSYTGLPHLRLWYTRLDEAIGFGSLLELETQTHVPISYLQWASVGLRPASPGLLADLILMGSSQLLDQPSSTSPRTTTRPLC